LGQTLGTWGVGHVPYIVLPLLGPSSLRDGLGIVGDGFLNPIYYLDDEWRYAVRGGQLVSDSPELMRIYDEVNAVTPGRPSETRNNASASCRSAYRARPSSRSP
ncbi:MAG: MlaA family lipoprotein, partial [Pseudomonadota bacterium]